eukprot:RCo028111
MGVPAPTGFHALLFRCLATLLLLLFGAKGLILLEDQCVWVVTFFLSDSDSVVLAFRGRVFVAGRGSSTVPFFPRSPRPSPTVVLAYSDMRIAADRLSFGNAHRVSHFKKKKNG